jgi:hypothetical protein
LNSVAFAASPALWFVVLTAAGYTLADVGRLPLATAELIRIVVFALLFLGIHERSVGPVMLLFLALSSPICRPKSQPGDKLPNQLEPQDEVSDEEKREATEKPRRKQSTKSSVV